MILARTLINIEQATNGQAQQQILRTIRNAARLLPARQRQIIALFYIVELNCEVLAELIGLDVLVVNDEKQRALQFMENYLFENGWSDFYGMLTQDNLQEALSSVELPPDGMLERILSRITELSEHQSKA